MQLFHFAFLKWLLTKETIQWHQTDLYLLSNLTLQAQYYFWMWHNLHYLSLKTYDVFYVRIFLREFCTWLKCSICPQFKWWILFCLSSRRKKVNSCITHFLWNFIWFKKSEIKYPTGKSNFMYLCIVTSAAEHRVNPANFLANLGEGKE